MPSSKGKPTDPKLREEAKKEVMNMEKGGGKGQWSAWKASEMAKVYEAKGGDYEDTGDNANEAKKGAPQPKKEAIAKGERKDPSEKVGTPKSSKTKDSDKDKKSTTKEDSTAASGQKRKNDDSNEQDTKPKSKSKSVTQDSEAKKETNKKSKTSATKETKKKPPTAPTREQPKRGSKK